MSETPINSPPPKRRKVRSILEGQAILKSILEANGILPESSLPRILLEVIMEEFLGLNECNTPAEFFACQTYDKKINFIIDTYNLE